jgi:hypothetical protein
VGRKSQDLTRGPASKCVGRTAAILAFAGLTALLPRSAHAEANTDVGVYRTRWVDAGTTPRSEPDPEQQALLAKIDAILYETVQDLGLSVDISNRAPVESGSDEELLRTAASAERWLVAPRLERRRGRLSIKILAAPPGSRVLYESVAPVEAEGLEKSLVFMMRDLVDAARGGKATASVTPVAAAPGPDIAQAHSPGRAILAVNATLLGGFVGYSLQRASGSTDERLTYPLTALGAGLGLGSALLVAEEWDITLGDAWFLSAGMAWPTLSATLIARGSDVSRANSYAYGLLGATAGVSLATTALGFGHISDGAALLTHSSGAFGTLLGGLLELSVDGTTNERPRLGAGLGAGAGVLIGGVVATQVSLPPSRVLMIDLGASLGALTGAAAASPLLLVDESAATNERRNRLWLASIATGTLIGGVAGYWFTRGGVSTAAHVPVLPTLGVIGSTPNGAAYGAGLMGTW